jgi:hypothetical protein
MAAGVCILYSGLFAPVSYAGRDEDAMEKRNGRGERLRWQRNAAAPVHLPHGIPPPFLPASFDDLSFLMITNCGFVSCDYTGS